MLPKWPRITAAEAEKILLANGFRLLRSKGSHRIYRQGDVRFVLPFHSGKILHPKIIKELSELVGAENLR